MENGEKAEIRIAHPWTYFNITNHARFENIEFTGEDMLAKATHNGVAFEFMDQWGPLAFMPFKKCTVKDDPKSLNTISDLRLQSEGSLNLDSKGMVFECDDDFVEADNVPPDAIDERCFPEYAAT